MCLMCSKTSLVVLALLLTAISVLGKSLPRFERSSAHHGAQTQDFTGGMSTGMNSALNSMGKAAELFGKAQHLAGGGIPVFG